VLGAVSDQLSGPLVAGPGVRYEGEGVHIDVTADGPVIAAEPAGG